MSKQEDYKILKSIIETKTEYNIDDLTGGSVSITITHNCTQINYYLILFFGYKNRNSIQKKIPINEQLYTKLCKIIVSVVKDMQKEQSEDDINDILNIVSNTDRTIGSKNNLTTDLTTPNYNYNLNNSNKVTKSYEKESDFSLGKTVRYSKVKEDYKEALKIYIEEKVNENNLKLENLNASHRVLDYDDFIMGIEAKDYEYANFVIAYRNWNKRHIERVSNVRK